MNSTAYLYSEVRARRLLGLSALASALGVAFSVFFALTF
jgi:hypothetical protein